MKQNAEVSFDCILFGIYRSIWQRLASREINANFIPFYQLINSLIEEIPSLYPAQNKKYHDSVKDIILVTREGQLPTVAAKIEDFLIGERGWKLDWGLYDEKGTILNFLKSSMLCIECLDLARVSERSEIYRFLFT